jgi:hypothetical protein
VKVGIKQRQELIDQVMAIATHRDCHEHRQGIKQKQADDKQDEDLPITLYESHRLKNTKPYFG